MRFSVVFALFVIGVVLASLIPQVSVSAANIRHVRRLRDRVHELELDHVDHETSARQAHIQALMRNQVIVRTSVSVGDNKPGRYVVLAAQTPQVCLNIAEVMVYSTDPTTNIAQNPPNTLVKVKQSSYWDRNAFPKNNLIDGITSNFAHTSCANTPGSGGHFSGYKALPFGPQCPSGDCEWMMVDLGADTPITRVDVYNRVDSCCTKRIAEGVVVSIFGADNGNVFTSPPLAEQPSQSVQLQL